MEFKKEDFFVAVICTLIAFPLCDASWVAIMTEGNALKGMVGLVFGVPIGIVGLSYHWWKDKWKQIFKPISDSALYWWPIAIIVAFSYVCGPEIYRRSTESRSLSGFEDLKEELRALKAPASAADLDRVTTPIIAELKDVQVALNKANQEKERAINDYTALKNKPPSQVVMQLPPTDDQIERAAQQRLEEAARAFRQQLDREVAAAKAQQRTEDQRLGGAVPGQSSKRLETLARLRLDPQGPAPIGILLNIDYLTDDEPLTIFIDFRQVQIIPLAWSAPVRIHRGEITSIVNGGNQTIQIASQDSGGNMKWITDSGTGEYKLTEPAYRVIVTLTTPSGQKQVESLGLVRLPTFGNPYSRLTDNLFDFLGTWKQEDAAAEEAKH
jgi:hypothetical protein